MDLDKQTDRDMKKTVDLSGYSSGLKYSSPEINGKWLTKKIKSAPKDSTIILPSGEFKIDGP